MIKNFSILLLLIIELVYFSMLGCAVKPSIDYNLLHPILIRASYIAEIKGDLLNVELTKKYLDKFNKYGHNNIVKYKAPKGIARPITIEIRPFGKDTYEKLQKDIMLGYAISTERSCIIVIKDDLVTEEQFKQVIIHEFLHCYFYDHTDINGDLMYPYYTPPKDSNIQAYALEVENRIK